MGFNKSQLGKMPKKKKEKKRKWLSVQAVQQIFSNLSLAKYLENVQKASESVRTKERMVFSEKLWCEDVSKSTETGRKEELK